MCFVYLQWIVLLYNCPAYIILIFSVVKVLFYYVRRMLLTLVTWPIYYIKITKHTQISFSFKSQRECQENNTGISPKQQASTCLLFHVIASVCAVILFCVVWTRDSSRILFNRLPTPLLIDFHASIFLKAKYLHFQRARNEYANRTDPNVLYISPEVCTLAD